MDAELREVLQNLQAASLPEDVFGAVDVVLPTETLLAELQKKYDPIRAITDPQAYTNPADSEAAEDANRLLEEFFEEAQRRIKDGLFGMKGYGQKRPSIASKSFRVGRNSYYIGQKLNADAHSTTYQGYLERSGRSFGEVLLKIANDPKQNSRLENEARILHLLHQTSAPQWKHIPFVLGQFQAGERMGLIFRMMSGFTMTEILQHPRHRRGVDQKHMVWMLDRALSALGFVHRQGVVHGNLTPESLIVHPEHHNVYISDWSASVYRPAVSGERIEAEHGDFTSPSVRDGGRVGPWSDIYSLGKVLIWLVGGDPQTNEVPATVHPEIGQFLTSLVSSASHTDAWDLYKVQCELKTRLWGRQFLHFDMN